MKLTQQIKQRRRELGLQQADMKMRIGMEQQQYQRIEAGGNPRLETLELVAEGLEAELVLVPKSKLRAVQELLHKEAVGEDRSRYEKTPLDENPWQDLLDKE